MNVTEKIKGYSRKNVMIGFGQDDGRIVVNSNGLGTTFYAADSSQGIGMCSGEKISVGITPGEVQCKESDVIKDPVGRTRLLFFNLGQNRALSVSYVAKGDLHVVYLPDEFELVEGTSEFLSGCKNRGLW